MEKLLRKFTKYSKQNKSLLSIYFDKNEIDKFYVGFIVDEFEDSILICSYDEYGESDGYLLIRLIDIFKIEKESTYLKKINIIRNDNLNFNENLKMNNKSGIDAVISICIKNKILTTIKLIYSDYIIGFVIEEDDKYYLIETFSKDGLFEGYTLIEYTDIQSISFKGKDENKITKLLEKS